MEIYLSKGKMHHERNYGIDFLRLVLMFMVCMLHTLGQGGILTTSVLGTTGYKVYWLIEIISYCAVDGFAVISGFVASDKPRNFEILVNMWFQAFFYSFVLTVILTFLGFNNKCSFADILKCAFPVINNKFWYFTSYFGLFFIIPVLNNYFFSISENNAKRILLIILFLFSAIGTLSDPFILYGGYSLIWLLVLYSTGILIKRIRLFEKQSNQVLLIYWGLSIAITWVVFVYFGDSHLVSYVSPTILINSIIMVVLFSRISLKGRIIKKISPFVFGIYLFQMNQVIWNNIFGSFSWIVGKSLYLGLPLVFASASVIL